VNEVALSFILAGGCLGASAAALRWRWSPPLAASLLIGLIVRVAIVFLAYGHTPHDVAVGNFNAAQAILHGRDPLTTLRKDTWNFLPFSAYLSAAAARTGLAWQYAAKLLPVAFDLATIPLVGEFARPTGQRRNSQLLYALSPVALFISAWHGQLDPISVFLGLSALLLARQQRTAAAGVVLGLAVTAESWPVLFLPGALLCLPVRRWWQLVAAAATMLAGWALVIPLVLHGSLAKALNTLTGYRGYAGTWGWSGLLRYAHLTAAGFGGPHVTPVQRAGTVLTVLAMVAVIAVFRHRPPEDVTVAIILAFLVTSAAVGPQYLIWPAALLYAARRPAGYLFLALSSIYVVLFYVYAFPRVESYSSWPGVVLEVISIGIELAAVASMPWRPADNQQAELTARGPEARTAVGLGGWMPDPDVQQQGLWGLGHPEDYDGVRRHLQREDVLHRPGRLVGLKVALVLGEKHRHPSRPFDAGHDRSNDAGQACAS
jgi:Glycosyltransferase family 87